MLQVQENCIDLVGRIADRGHEFVPAREWMRICFELLDMLKAHKKAIRRATVNTFGYIAKAIGPQVRPLCYSRQSAQVLQARIVRQRTRVLMCQSRWVDLSYFSSSIVLSSDLLSMT